MTPLRGNLAARLIEVAASMAALWGMWQLFVNWADSNIGFFGESPTVEVYHVATYQQFAAVGIVAAFAALVVSHLRGGRKALAWHCFVGLAVVVSLAIFYVEVASPNTNDTPDGSTSGPNRTACNSGGSSAECIGG